MTKSSKGLTVTALLDQDGQTITAYFNELPGLMVQGRSEAEIQRKLLSHLEVYIKRLNSNKGNLDIQKKSFA